MNCMPYRAWHLRVFVAAPSDLDDERAALEEVITELNLTSARILGVWLELVSWQTHAFPAIGSDAQAIINTQIDDAYEIFVGLLWSKIGTPTPRAPSGTLEEYRRAHERFKISPDSISVLLYFKTTPISPMDIRAQDLAALQEFRQELPAEGILHWPFKDVEDFRSLLRIHLTRTIEVWKRRLPAIQDHEVAVSNNSGEVSSGNPELVSNEDDDFGLLDYSQRLEELAAEIPELFQKLSVALDRLSRGTETRGALIQELVRTQPVPRSNEIKELINGTAMDLISYAETLELTTASFSMKFSSFMDCASRFMVESVALGSMAMDRLTNDKAATEQFGQIVRATREKADGFRKVVEGLPRMTSELNRAKRRALAAHEKWSAELLRVEQLAEQLATQIGNSLRETGAGA